MSLCGGILRFLTCRMQICFRSASVLRPDRLHYLKRGKHEVIRRLLPSSAACSPFAKKASQPQWRMSSEHGTFLCGQCVFSGAPGRPAVFIDLNVQSSPFLLLNLTPDPMFHVKPQELFSRAWSVPVMFTDVDGVMHSYHCCCVCQIEFWLESGNSVTALSS